MSAELLDELANDIEEAMDNVHDMGVSLRSYAEAAAQAVYARMQNMQQWIDHLADEREANEKRIRKLEQEAHR